LRGLAGTLCPFTKDGNAAQVFDENGALLHTPLCDTL
jgi:hypothetical protein